MQIKFRDEKIDKIFGVPDFQEISVIKKIGDQFCVVTRPFANPNPEKIKINIGPANNLVEAKMFDLKNDPLNDKLEIITNKGKFQFKGFSKKGNLKLIAFNNKKLPKNDIR